MKATVKDDHRKVKRKVRRKVGQYRRVPVDNSKSIHRLSGARGPTIATLHLPLPILSNQSPYPLSTLSPLPLPLFISSPIEIITKPKASPGEIFSFAGGELSAGKGSGVGFFLDSWEWKGREVAWSLWEGMDGWLDGREIDGKREREILVEMR